jgi:hypothetical protein
MGEQRRIVTRRLPAWVEDRDGELVLIPEREAAVKRIFELAVAGYGHPGIIKRLDAVQVFFVGDGSRTYLIYHQPARANRRGDKGARWWARSFADAGLPAGDLDLRLADHAQRLERALESVVI